MFLCYLNKYLWKVLIIDTNFAYVPNNAQMAMVIVKRELWH